MRAFPLASLLLCALASRAAANPHALPYTYPSESLSKGATELELASDFTPVQVANPDKGPTAASTGLRFTEVFEFEYGITSRLELGLYLQFFNDPGNGVAGALDGIKQRLRYRFAAPGEWPLDVAVYLELAEMSDEIELEAKLNFQRRFGLATLMVNLWGEREFYLRGGGAWVLHPTGGITYQIDPHLHVGVEAWMNAAYGDGATDPASLLNNSPHYYVGPTVLLMFGRMWWSAGVYARLDSFGESAPLSVGATNPNYAVQYGPLWVRTMLGVDL